MSWDKTYSHTLALGVDRFGAALIFNQPDITISSLCWLYREARHDGAADKRLDELKLYVWQLGFLHVVGNFLEYFWPGHCADARLGDLDTTQRTRVLLAA